MQHDGQSRRGLVHESPAGWGEEQGQTRTKTQSNPSTTRAFILKMLFYVCVAGILSGLGMFEVRLEEFRGHLERLRSQEQTVHNGGVVVQRRRLVQHGVREDNRSQSEPAAV